MIKFYFFRTKPNKGFDLVKYTYKDGKTISKKIRHSRKPKFWYSLSGTNLHGNRYFKIIMPFGIWGFTY